MKKFFLLSFLIISFNLHTSDLDEKESPQSESYKKLIEDHPEFEVLLADANIAPDKVTSVQKEFESIIGPIIVHFMIENKEEDKVEEQSKSFLRDPSTGKFYNPDDGFEE